MGNRNYVVVLFGKAFNHGVEMGCMTEFKNICLQVTLNNQCCNNCSENRYILRDQHCNLIWIMWYEHVVSKNHKHDFSRFF